MPQIPVFVINLKRSKERRARAQEVLGSLGLAYEFIEAVDGNDLSEREVAEIRRNSADPRTRLRGGTNSLSRGEIGCALSHLKVFELIVKDNLDYACIMEDDLVIKHAGNLRTMLERDTLVALSQKGRFGFINLFPNWDNTFWMNENFPNISVTKYNTRWRRISIKEGLYMCKPCKSPMWGNVCYIVTKETCEILLKEARRTFRPSDVLTACSEIFGVKSFLIDPAPIGHDFDNPSTIDPHRKIRSGKKNRFTPTLWKLATISFKMILRRSGIIPYKWLIKKNTYYE